MDGSSGCDDFSDGIGHSGKKSLPAGGERRCLSGNLLSQVAVAVGERDRLLGEVWAVLLCFSASCFLLELMCGERMWVWLIVLCCWFCLMGVRREKRRRNLEVGAAIIRVDSVFDSF
jgi:hypothetical protein